MAKPRGQSLQWATRVLAQTSTFLLGACFAPAPAPAPLQVCGDASILFPLIISQTFARHWEPKPEAEQAPASGDAQAAA